MITRNTANKILEGFFGRQGNFSLASSCYIGLSTTTPDAAGSNFSEPSSSSGYARVMLGTQGQSNTYVMDAAVNGSICNTSNIIFFPEATASWGTVTHFGLFSSKTGGTPILWGALSSSISIPSGYIPIFRAGALTVSLQ